MSFFDWISISTGLDIFCIVFIVALVLKCKSLNKKLLSYQKTTEEDLTLLKKDVEISLKGVKNPAAARRLLNKRQ